MLKVDVVPSARQEQQLETLQTMRNGSGHSAQALTVQSVGKYNSRFLPSLASTTRTMTPELAQRIADWVSTVEPTEETSSNGEEFSSVA